VYGQKEAVMSIVTIVYHSGYGHTRRQAEAVMDGATGVEGTEVHLVAVDDLDSDDMWRYLDDADAIVFGAPTYMGGPSAPFKAFMDATSVRWQQQAWKDKLAAGFTNSAGINGDKLNTLESFSLLAMQHSMVWVGLGLKPGNITAEGSPEDLNRLAGFLGAMAQSNADAAPEVAPAGSDLRTATHLGRRVAEAAGRWGTGRLAGASAVSA
jgi:NAD(P)H dehydrogenase (quinone)